MDFPPKLRPVALIEIPRRWTHFQSALDVRRITETSASVNFHTTLIANLGRDFRNLMIISGRDL